MPSETVDFCSLSSSLYSSEDLSSSNEASFWKSDNLPKCYDFDQGIKPGLNVQAGSNFSDSSKVDLIATQYESSLFSSSLSELFSRKLSSSAKNALYGHSADTVASHYEEDRLFDSLEELEAQIIGNLLPNDDDLLSSATDGLDHIVEDGAGDNMEEPDLFVSVGGMDLGDDDSSSSGQNNSGILDGACNSQPELSSASIVGEQPYDEHSCRTLVVRNISSDVEDSELKALFELFGDIQTIYTACKLSRVVVTSYYDIRAAQNAMRAHQNRLFSCKKFDIHYSNPKDSPSKNDMNQGTLAVFLYDSSISNNELHSVFNVYGEIKEIHESQHGEHHKLIEYYDIRAAAVALHALNKNETTRKRLKVEPSRDGGSKSMVQQIQPELEQKESSLLLHQNNPPRLHVVTKSGSVDGGRIFERATCTPPLETGFLQGVSSSVPNNLTSLARIKSVDSRCEFTEPNSPGQLNFDMQVASAFHPHSLPECHDGLANGVHHIPPEGAANINLKSQKKIDNIQFCQVNSNGHFTEFDECVSKSSGNGSFPLPGRHYKWCNSYQPHGMIWQNSPSYFDEMYAFSTMPRLHGLPMSPSHMMTSVVPINSQHMPSASLWDRRHAYAGESPKATAFHPGSLGNMWFSGNTEAHRVDFVSHNIFPHFGGNYVDLQILPKNVGHYFHNQKSLMFPRRNHLINSFETYKQRARSRRNEGVADKKQYELDIDRLKRGEDNRTTLMIKNIPNKYTSKMLLATIDEHHKGTYDFVYLPIDFKNKCNVGYAFINMTNPSLIIPFYQVFNGKKWEKFNSEKVASLAYARIQGKAALIAHFQNSSLMNEDKRCRPILFNTEGPNAGDPVPFPVGFNICNKHARVRNNIREDYLQVSLPNLGNCKLSSDGDNHSLESD